MTEQVPEQLRNAYADEDLRKIVAEIEGFEDEKVSVRAAAAGKCSQITKRITNAKKTAKKLGIPKASLNGLLKARKLERQLKEVAGDVPDDEAEVFEDMVKVLGEFGGTPLGEAAISAAEERAAAAKANQEAEQAEGAAVLNEIATVA